MNESQAKTDAREQNGSAPREELDPIKKAKKVCKNCIQYQIYTCSDLILHALLLCMVFFSLLGKVWVDSEPSSAMWLLQDEKAALKAAKKEKALAKDAARKKEAATKKESGAGKGKKAAAEDAKVLIAFICPEVIEVKLRQTWLILPEHFIQWKQSLTGWLHWKDRCSPRVLPPASIANRILIFDTSCPITSLEAS